MACFLNTWPARLDQHRDRRVDGEGGGEDEDDDGVVGPGAAKDPEVQRQVSPQIERLLIIMRWGRVISHRQLITTPLPLILEADRERNVACSTAIW